MNHKNNLISIKMYYSSVVFISVVSSLVADAMTGNLQNKDVEPRRCYHCTPGNSTTACHQREGVAVVVCPPERPLCATIAVAPNFTSSLSCAVAADRPCSLTYSPKQTHEVTCLCNEHLCNAPFTRELQQGLLNMSFANISKNNESADLNDMLHKLYAFANATAAPIYERITVEPSMAIATGSPNNFSNAITSSNVSSVTKTMKPPVTVIGHSSNGAPRAEALKQEATAPSDDDEDEDESEGSGAHEEARPQRPQRRPAAPSSYLPADENKASPLFINTLVTTLLLLHVIL